MPLSPSAHADTFCRDNLPPETTWPDILEPPSGSYRERLNCATELLDRTASLLGGERTCLLTPDGHIWTYADLVRVSNQIAHLLVDEYGLVPGNRVMLRGPNSPWLVACWFGVLKAGGVVVCTVPLLRSSELRTICEIARVDLALCDSRLLDEVEAADLPRLRVATFGPGSDFARDLADKPEVFKVVDTAADDVALLAFTSGTTGRPKATMHFHRDVLVIADTFSASILQPTPDDLFTGTPPLAFTFGLGGLVIFPLRVGAGVLLAEMASPDELAGLIARFKVTICFTAPTAYRAMLAAGETDRLGTLRRAVSAGEHLPASTWNAFYDATGVKLIDGIGATEMLHIFISASEDDVRPGSTGKPVPGYRARLVDEQGQPVHLGRPGRLAVKGPTGCRYLDDERQRDYVQGGWNVTGDIFTQDDDGFFWYVSRSDDMIISSGYNIASYEVEEALLSHPDVVECAVVGTPDEARGQIVTAFVVLAGNASPGAAKVEELQLHAKARIAPYKYPRKITFCDSLPRTVTGKLQRFVLRSSEPQSSD
jgi:2-aminobenzoate-CoA ligase